MDKPLRVLIVEDSEDDAELVLRELRRDSYNVAFERVDTPQSMSAALESESWDIVLSDHDMPLFNAPAALRLLRDSGLDIPFIIVSGAIGEEAAVAAMRAGAHDYLTKGNLTRLNAAVDREMREAEMRRDHRLKADEERRLHRQLEDKQLELNSRLNQITALNRLFQQHLSHRSEVAEVYDEVIEVLQRHVDDTAALVARARSQPISQLHDLPGDEGGGVIPPARSGEHVEDEISLQPAAPKSPYLIEGSIIVDPQREPAPQPIRVLIADGDESVRRSIQVMLDQADGITVAGETGDGERVIDLVRSLTPDVVLLDVRMPTLDSIETVRRMREAGFQTVIRTLVGSIGACLLIVNVANYWGMMVRGKLIVLMIFITLFAVARLEAVFEGGLSTGVSAILGPVWIVTAGFDPYFFDENAWHLYQVVTASGFWAWLTFREFTRRYRTTDFFGRTSV